MPKILIVDDDRTTVKLLQTLLEMDGFEVMMAGRGQAAIELARQNQPDIILVDYHLTDMEGSELVSRFRAETAFAELPIVMASGLDVADAARKAGANAFLIKPFEPGKLAALFYGLLG
ncbi:MAG: response regulator [Chloroflexota bacterium]|nr:response regulator [Anaerolineae bacterium]HMM27470.1 response regulator [Aggregatilineaceae bacterium]